ncbi:MAG TPA: hypothetical protein VLL48_12015 [Longimicrobiales bacterium]|nr:hypothetical protein [Longimicrobiales bacterium]
MILVPASVAQAAAEYGALNSEAATGVSSLARRVTDSAGEAWAVVSADPLLVAGVVVVGILAILVLRSPAR